jgi:hypothetical protein
MYFRNDIEVKIIDDESYLLSAIRYIHQNPIKPGIGTVENYRWSSYRDYMDHGRDLTDKDDILGIISNDRIRAKKSLPVLTMIYRWNFSGFD